MTLFLCVFLKQYVSYMTYHPIYFCSAVIFDFVVRDERIDLLVHRLSSSFKDPLNLFQISSPSVVILFL